MLRRSASLRVTYSFILQHMTFRDTGLDHYFLAMAPHDKDGRNMMLITVRRELLVGFARLSGSGFWERGRAGHRFCTAHGCNVVGSMVLEKAKCCFHYSTSMQSRCPRKQNKYFYYSKIDIIPQNPSPTTSNQHSSQRDNVWCSAAFPHQILERVVPRRRQVWIVDNFGLLNQVDHRRLGQTDQQQAQQ